MAPLGSMSLLPTIWLVATPVDGFEAPHELFGQDVVEVPALTDAEITQRRAEFLDRLENGGWVQHGDQVLPGDIGGGFAQPTQVQQAWGFGPHRATIFLNFFGATLSPGTNADLDESSCIPSQMEWPGFAGTEQQALALIEIFENQMAPYGVRIAYDERPPSHLPYAMVMMGGSPQMLGMDGNVLGVSCSSDCGDRWWRDTTFAFTDNISPSNASTLGTTALHEAAHAFGLAHIGDSTKVMNPFVGNSSVTWADECVPYDDATGGINCKPTHDEFCGGGAQNSHAELMAYFGANSPDVVPPDVEILSPADGLELEVGASVTVEADIFDDHEGVGWRFVIPEVGQESVAYNFEKTWNLKNLPEGVYTLRVEAIDHDRNEASDEVTIYVGTTPAETPDGMGTGGDDEPDAGSGGSGGEDPEPSGDTEDDAGLDMGATDGGCTVGGSNPAAWWMLLPLFAVFRRRRSRD